MADDGLATITSRSRGDQDGPPRVKRVIRLARRLDIAVRAVFSFRGDLSRIVSNALRAADLGTIRLRVLRGDLGPVQKLTTITLDMGLDESLREAAKSRNCPINL